MHIISLFSHTQHLEEVLNLVFLFILPSQIYPDVQIPAAFYECCITVMIALLHTTAAQKNFCITSWCMCCIWAPYLHYEQQAVDPCQQQHLGSISTKSFQGVNQKFCEDDISYYNINKIRVGFDGGCLKQDQGIIPLKGIVNIYIVYEVTI